MSLWAISAAPLLAGADLTTLSDATLATLTNPEVIAVDQDSLGLQGVKVASYGDGLEIWSKALSTPGERAVLLLNRTGDPAAIAVHWGDLGLSDPSPAMVRDLWARKDLGSFDSSYSATVQSNDAVMLIIRGRDGKLTTYTPAGADGVRKDEEVSFIKVSSRARVARVRISYINPDKALRIAELRVNGRISTRIAFPSTGSDKTAGAVWIEAPLDREGATNVLNFSHISGPGLNIESIAVE
jgi:hypothetical protein